MDRRHLLRSLVALGGAATALALPGTGQAAPLFDELERMEAKSPVPDADLPAEGARDSQWTQRCTWRTDRYGRRVRICRPVARPRPRRCWWTRDRWGRRIRVCR